MSKMYSKCGAMLLCANDPSISLGVFPTFDALLS